MIRCFIQNSLTHWTSTQTPCPFPPPGRSQTPCIHFLSFIYRPSSTMGFYLHKPSISWNILSRKCIFFSNLLNIKHHQPCVLRTLTLANSWTKLSNIRPILQSGVEYFASFTEYCTKSEKQNGCMGSEGLWAYQSFSLVMGWLPGCCGCGS